MHKIKKADKVIFNVSSAIILLLSIADTYFLLKYEHFSQLLWFCNAALFLLAYGLFFRKSIVITGVFLGAIAVQLPWVLDFFAKLLFGRYLFGVSSYMFDYGFSSIRFYVELNHLLIIPLSLYGIKKTGFHKNGWVLAAVVAMIINAGAYAFSSYEDNVNCVFYNCINQKIILSRHPFIYFILWTAFISVLMFVLNKVIYKMLNTNKLKK